MDGKFLKKMEVIVWMDKILHQLVTIGNYEDL